LSTSGAYITKLPIEYVCCIHNILLTVSLNLFQSIWHVEWLLDLLILWALSSMGELKSAHNMLESLKSRSDMLSLVFCRNTRRFINSTKSEKQPDCRVRLMDRNRQQAMQKAIKVCNFFFLSCCHLQYVLLL
jgi:hypothetical protein